jgi:cobalamin biosynthesis protein CbiM
MHFFDGIFDPKIASSFLGAAVGFGAFALSRIKQKFLVKKKRPVLATPEGNVAGGGEITTLSKYGKKQLVNMILVGSYIFMMQMVDFTIIGGEVGHFLGGALAGILLGPFAGMIVISLILIIQAFFLADGGVIALGINIFNMAIIGAVGGYYIFTYLKKNIKQKAVIVILSVWLSVIFAALAYQFESMLVGEVFNTAFIQTHMIVGFAEGFITLLMLRAFNYKK